MTSKRLAYNKLLQSAGALIFFGLLLMHAVPSYASDCEPAGTHSKGCLSEENPYLTKEFTVDDHSSLKVYTVAGNIEVQTVENTDKVRVELYIDRGYSFWSHNKSLDNYRITVIQQGKEVVASVERKNRETGFFSDQMRFSYKVYVPRKISSDLKTAAGNVTIGGMEGKHIIKSSGGNIDLNGISGKLSAYTAGGNIKISESRGVLYGKTIGGNITIDNSQGEVRLQSNAGQVIAERISGTLLVQLGAGDIKAQMLKVSEGVRLDTRAGNIYLQIPFKEGYDLVLNGSNVEIPDGFSYSGYKSRSKVEGTVLGGGPPINLSTTHGNIILKND